MERDKSEIERKEKTERKRCIFIKREERERYSCIVMDIAAINSSWPWQGVIENVCRRAKKMSLTRGSEIYH